MIIGTSVPCGKERGHENPAAATVQTSVATAQTSAVGANVRRRRKHPPPWRKNPAVGTPTAGSKLGIAVS